MALLPGESTGELSSLEEAKTCQGGGGEVSDTRSRGGLEPILVSRPHTAPRQSKAARVHERLPQAGPRTSHTVPLQRASLGEVPVRGGQDAVRALPARVAPPEVRVTMGWRGAQRQGQGDGVSRPQDAKLPRRESHHQGEAGGRSGGGSEQEGGHNSITYRRWAGQGAEQGALEAWGCPALPAFAGRFARRSCCEVCGGSTGVRGGGQGGAEVTGLGPALPEREPGRLPSAPRPTGSLGCRPPRPGRYLARTAWAGRAPRAPLVLRAVAMEEVLCGTCGRREGSVLRPHGHPDGEANGQAGGL